jgi:phospholipid/cholesterol/gamma-HCH transport system substrate-binding protein
VSAVGAMTRTRLRWLGAGFALLLVGLLGLSVLAYCKAFTPVARVTLHTGHAGMQMLPGADVKLRGVLVGDVRTIAANGEDATLSLAIDPAQLPNVPDDVTARLLPKTLFGERYVELIPGPSTAALRDGAVIGQDRSSSAVELEHVLDQALPLLQAIQPDKLAATLGALAYAVDGRGEMLGRDLSTANGYLTELNKQMPVIAGDVRRLVTVLDTYDGALSDVLEVLRNATVTMKTITDQRDELARFLADTTDLAKTTQSFLDRYDDRIIQLGDVSRPVLELLAAYAPEYPCLLKGLVALQPRVEKVFSTGRMHITLETTRDNGKFVKGRDEPVYGASSGPNCRGLASPGVPAPEVRVNDGYSGTGAPAAGPAAMGIAGTADEKAAIKPILAAAGGTAPEDISDLAVLLWGPMMRGTVVSVG